MTRLINSVKQTYQHSCYSRKLLIIWMITSFVLEFIILIPVMGLKFG